MEFSNLRYKHIEAALAEAYNVDPERLPAFRARLRYLRGLRVPLLPQVGSGTQISYTFQHVVELVVGLELEALGFPPKEAAGAVNGLRDIIANNFRKLSAKGPVFVIATPNDNFIAESRESGKFRMVSLNTEAGLRQQLPHLIGSGTRVIFGNISLRIEPIKAALASAAT